MASKDSFKALESRLSGRMYSLAANMATTTSLKETEERLKAELTSKKDLMDLRNEIEGLTKELSKYINQTFEGLSECAKASTTLANAINNSTTTQTELLEVSRESAEALTEFMEVFREWTLK